MPPQPPGLQVLVVSLQDTVGPVQVVLLDSDIAPQLFGGVQPAPEQEAVGPVQVVEVVWFIVPQLLDGVHPSE